MGYENTAWFHDEWYYLLQPENNPEHFSPLPWHKLALKQFHLEAPRKHAKSECVAVNYVSWLIGNFPNIKILIVSKTGDLAEATVGAVKQRIESDNRYRRVFGDLKPKDPQKWTDSQFIVNRPEISKFPTLKGCGLGGALTGGGNDLIVADDIIDEENVRTPLQLEKADTWFFKVLLTTLFAHGACFALGTRWHYADIYKKLLKLWPNKVYRAIQNIEEVDKGTVPIVLWPEIWPYKRLMERKEVIGSIFFTCQYQNDPTPMEGDLLKGEWLHPWNEEKHDFSPPSTLPVYAGIDPSLGESDYFGIASFSFDALNRQGYLLDVWAEHMSFPEIASVKFPQLHTQYKYKKIFIEANFWQKLLLKFPEFQTHPETGKPYPIVPVQTVKNKTERFIPLSSHFESKRVKVNPLLLNNSEFWTEWVQFPRGQHDDAVDCVDLVVSNVLSRGPIQVLTGKSIHGE